MSAKKWKVKEKPTPVIPPPDAMLHTTTCKCLGCGNEWREDQFCFRTYSGYSYELNRQRMEDLASGLIQLVGRRCLRKDQPMCHACVKVPARSEWPKKDPIYIPGVEEIAIEGRRKKTNSRGVRVAAPSAKKQAIDNFMDDLLS